MPMAWQLAKDWSGTYIVLMAARYYPTRGERFIRENGDSAVELSRRSAIERGFDFARMAEVKGHTTRDFETYQSITYTLV